MNRIMPLIKTLNDYLKRNEKKMLIENSGSTKYNHYEKIRAGQSYLYKSLGMESEVIEIRFDKKASGSKLNEALRHTLKRYPYFNTRLIELDGDFYIVQNNTSIVARKSKRLAKLGSINCGYHLIDITYFGNSIFVSFHHALCDGRGIMPFIETLIYYYCNGKYAKTNPPEGIHLENDGLLDGETIDPFSKEYTYNHEKKFISLSREAFSIPEGSENNKESDFRYEIKINQDDFISLCKQNNATPVILVSLLMSRGIAKLYPEYERINANIAMDMRKALNVPNTFKNCVKSMILPYDSKIATLSLEEQATYYRELLKEQRDEDYCKKEANSMLMLFDKLDSLKSFKEKQEIMGFFENMKLDTYTISYLGQFKLGENKKHIKEIHLYNSGTAGLGINMVSTGDVFILDFKQSFQTSKYVDIFCQELKEIGIKFTKSNAIAFNTPCDSIVKHEIA